MSHINDCMVEKMLADILVLDPTFESEQIDDITNYWLMLQLDIACVTPAGFSQLTTGGSAVTSEGSVLLDSGECIWSAD